MRGPLTTSRLLTLALFGAVCLLPPLVLLFDVPTPLGLSRFALVLFVLWLVLIGLTAVIVERDHDQ